MLSVPYFPYLAIPWICILSVPVTEIPEHGHGHKDLLLSKTSEWGKKKNKPEGFSVVFLFNNNYKNNI